MSMAYSRDVFAIEKQSREERRPSDLTGWLMSDADEAIWDFSVIDLSYGGCKIVSSASLRKGELVRLSFRNRGLINAVVRWKREDRVGLSFAIEPPTAQLLPRQAKRHRISTPVMVRRVGRRSQIIDAHDVSTKGCCLHFVDPPKENEIIWIRLPGLEPLEAEIRWVKSFRCGTKFRNQVHEKVFELMLTRLDEIEASIPKTSRLKF